MYTERERVMELPEVEDKMLTIATCVSDRASW